MDYKEPIIEFLAQPENMSLLLELEDLIPKVKQYKYNKYYDKFEKDYLKPMDGNWSGYSIISESDDNLVLRNELFKNGEYFGIHFHTRMSGWNNWYGILCGRKASDLELSGIQEVKDLRAELTKLGLTRTAKPKYFAWKYLERNRETLLTLPNDKAIEDFLKSWVEIFWDFANRIKKYVEYANKAILETNFIKV